jgi:hypothetical protein
MTQSGYGDGGGPLTSLELQRLRPSVNVAALEQWLAATHGALRRAIIAHFATEVTDDDLAEVRRETGAADDNGTGLSEIVAEDDAATIHVPTLRSPRGRSFRFISSWQPVVIVDPSADPALLTLWHAIEPRNREA